jgi:hypothetical protein
METQMKRFALVLAASAALAAPAAAQTLTVLLPVISFPDTVIAPSTKGCALTSVATVCQLQE